MREISMPDCPNPSSPLSSRIERQRGAAGSVKVVGAAVAIAIWLLLPFGAGHAQQKLAVVATVPTFAAIAQEVGGDLANVEAIARGDEDPHFVNARPSFAAMIQRADLFISTGLDLELWAPGLLDRANNSRVIEGAPGNVVASAGIRLLEVPQNVSRSSGDVHVFGNPHVHTDPINAIIVARNIAAGFKRVDPGNAAKYDARLANFEDRIMQHLFGDRLVEILGKETLFQLASTGRFWDFAKEQRLQGKPLTDFVGGWLAEGAVFRGRKMVCYHKNWAYFSNRFQVECAMFIEPKPGIPASPGHVREVIDFIKQEHIPVLFAANYFSRSQVERVASRAGATAVVVPEHVHGEEGIDDYFALMDAWVSRLKAAFEAHSTN